MPPNTTPDSGLNWTNASSHLAPMVVSINNSNPLYLCTFILGLAANATALASILFYRSLNKLFVLLVNMILADMFILQTGCYLRFYSELHIGDTLLCKLVNMLDIALLHVSCYTIVVLAFERFLLLRDPGNPGAAVVSVNRSDYKKELWACLALWAVSLVIAFPQGWYTYYDEGSKACVAPLLPLDNIYHTLLFITSYIVPGGLVTGLYAAIIHKTWTSDQAHVIGTDRQHRVTIMLAAIILLSWGLHGPFWTCFLRNSYTGSQCAHIEHTIVLTYVNAAVNPFLYTLLSTTSCQWVLLPFRLCGFHDHQEPPPPVHVPLDTNPRGTSNLFTPEYPPGAGGGGGQQLLKCPKQPTTTTANRVQSSV